MDLLTLVGAWTPWLLLAPLVLWLATRIRVEQGRVWQGLAAHGLVLATLVLAGLMFRSLWPALMAAFLPETAQERAAAAQLAPPWVREQRDGAEGQRDVRQTPAPLQTPEATALRRPPGPPPFARVAIDALLYGVLASVGAAMAASRRARERERSTLKAEAELARARLAALQLQLNPHFLFNALNGIASLIHTDPHVADDMLGDLSHLLRAALDMAGSERITLAREMLILDSYLGIEQRRFGARLKVIKHIAAQAQHALVPPFVLQPLVENAIKHGIERRRGQGTVTITAALQGARLTLSVHDDGPGVAAAASDARGFGIGLANTRERLQQLCAGDFMLSLANAPAGGCVATIELPYLGVPAGPRAGADAAAAHAAGYAPANPRASRP